MFCKYLFLQDLCHAGRFVSLKSSGGVVFHTRVAPFCISSALAAVGSLQQW